MDIVRNEDTERKEQIGFSSPRQVADWVGSPRGVDETSLDRWFADVTGWLKVLVARDQVVELRALKVGQGGYKPTWSGFFDLDHVKQLAEEALKLTFAAEGVYLTLNPLNRDLLSRRCNRADVAGEGDVACDRDVLRRRWLLIDVDAVRISGVSANEEERALAWELVSRVKEELRRADWPDPVVADSGNGYHLLYRVDLPAEDGELVKRALAALAARFDTDRVKVDRKVFNPARIVKLYGTLARKGDHTAERPHRWSGVIEIPDEAEVVPVGLLEALAGDAPAPSATVTARRGGSTRPHAFGREAARQRAGAYLGKVPPAVSGQNGHGQTFNVACKLVLGFGLSVEEALPLMRAWNETCQPRWSDKELRHKLLDADKQPGERGYLLADGTGRGSSDGDVPPAETNDQSASSGDEPLKSDDDPHRLARLILTKRFDDQGVAALRYWRGQWWSWSDGAYALLGEGELRAELWSATEKEFDRLNLSQRKERVASIANGNKQGSQPRTHKVTGGLVSNVGEALASLTIVPSSVEQPCWLKDGATQKREWVATRNGILNLDRLLAGEAEVLVPHSPRWFSAVRLPYDFDPEAACPKWFWFLQKNLEGDAERIALLQEWFGYCLLPDTSQQKFLLLQGEGSNGKSVACAVLTALLGEANVSHVPLESFGQRFALTGTLNKLANVASEVGELDRVAEGALKQFTSGDRMTFDRKGIDPVEAMPTARLVLATNNLPRFSDRSGGVWRRLLLVPFRVEITQAERVPGMDKPAWWVASDELPGVFNWAAEGLKRLRRVGRFTEPGVCADALEQYRTENNPARSFLTEHCAASPAGQAVSEQVYAGYKQWCQGNGYQPLGSATFGKEVRRVFPNVKRRKLRDRLERYYCYDGISYLPPARSPWVPD